MREIVVFPGKRPTRTTSESINLSLKLIDPIVIGGNIGLSGNSIRGYVHNLVLKMYSTDIS